MVTNNDSSTNNISFLNHAQYLQRFFTFMTSSENLGNKKTLRYHACFRDKNTKGPKRCEQPQVES